VRDLAERVQLVVGGRVGVLHRDPGAELDVLADGGAERLVVGQSRLVQRRQVELDEALALRASVIRSPRWTSMRCANPSSRVKRSGPPNVSAVNIVRCSTCCGCPSPSVVRLTIRALVMCG